MEFSAKFYVFLAREKRLWNEVIISENLFHGRKLNFKICINIMRTSKYILYDPAEPEAKRNLTLSVVWHDNLGGNNVRLWRKGIPYNVCLQKFIY